MPSLRHRPLRKSAERRRHRAADELGQLGPEAGEEPALAGKRQGMMQAEKVTQDLKDAASAVSGPASPIAGISAIVRRLERRAGQAPHLIEPSVRALDDAIDALEEAAQTLQRALDAARPGGARNEHPDHIRANAA